MRTILLNILLILASQAFTQNYIGMHKDDIILTMKKDQPQFKLDRNAVNRSYNYLKFVDKISEQTILYFLSDKNICTYVRWMSDYANLNEVINELDRKYKKKSKLTWYYFDKGQQYEVKLEEGDWFFTVNIRKK
ncbi:MAG: hypothetical protein JXR41_13760 [Bacteroidales bacterium]|nr:hypothetical protein [Bacteroidales bacterium]MBN2764153.1 hypothetical protein [Bacteroidales bacterium]